MRKMLLVASAWACTPSWGLAQTPVTDPAAPVPVVPYHSAFEPATKSEAADSAGVKPADWRQANADTGRNQRGHMDVLQWETEAEVGQPPAKLPSLGGTPLWPAQAVKLALLKQPDLFTRVNMSAFERTQTQAGVLKLTRSVYRAWIEAVAARQSLAYLREVHEAAQTATELAERMTRVGNWSKVQLLREQLLRSDAATQVALAQQKAFSANENLVRLLGLWGADAQINLPQRLPDLPTLPLPATGLEDSAVRNRPELVLASINARLELTAVGEPELLRWQKATDQALGTTPAAPTSPEQALLAPQPLTAPVLDTQRLRLSPALEQAATAQIHAGALAVATRSQAREAYYRYRTAYDLARHQRDEVAPLNTALQEETQLRYNGMLQSTWDLLASATARIQSVNAAVQAQRDFWLADTDLQAVLAGAEISFADEPRNPGASSGANKGH